MIKIRRFASMKTWQEKDLKTLAGNGTVFGFRTTGAAEPALLCGLAPDVAGKSRMLSTRAGSVPPQEALRQFLAQTIRRQRIQNGDSHTACFGECGQVGMNCSIRRRRSPTNSARRESSAFLTLKTRMTVSWQSGIGRMKMQPKAGESNDRSTAQSIGLGECARDYLSNRRFPR